MRKRFDLNHLTSYGTISASLAVLQNDQPMINNYCNRIETVSGPTLLVAVVMVVLFSFGKAHAQLDGFDLVSTSGEKLSIRAAEQPELTVLYFTGIECPLAKLYAPRVKALAKEYSDSTRFFGINSNQQDSNEEFKEFVAAHQFAFPCGKDFNNVVADQFNVKRTPEVIVLDKGFKIRYRGRIDDQYSPGVARSAVKRQDLKLAIQELLAGKAVSQPRTAPEGCLLGRVKKPVEEPTVTFANQVSRIFQKNCVECHRTGEVAPFVLDDYEEAVGWGDMIVETIDNGRMPPWHADPDHGSFSNQRGLSDSDKELVRQWVRDGAPLGDAADLPKKQTFTAGWNLPRAPDLVIEMRKKPFDIPADGTVDYQYFVVDPKFKEDKWVSAAEVVPGNRSVVHHSIVFIRPRDGTDLPGIGWLGAYVPGQTNLEFEPTRARFVPAGSKLVFQQHYTPNGTPQQDITKVGLIFADADQVTHELQTNMAIDNQFEIKPNDPAFKVTTRLRSFPRDGKLLSISPHMHFRGKSFTATMVKRKNVDGEKSKFQTLLHVPQYDFNWQHIYQLNEPVSLSDVRTITAEIVFDNSAANPFNPDPNKYVTWGDQTWEEMAIGFFDISVPRKPPAKGPEKKILDDSNELSEAESKKLQAKIDHVVNDFFERFDSDDDGTIMRSELPLAMRTGRGYSRFNTDGKRGLTRDEVAAEARRRLEKRD